MVKDLILYVLRENLKKKDDDLAIVSDVFYTQDLSKLKQEFRKYVKDVTSDDFYIDIDDDDTTIIFSRDDNIPSIYISDKKGNEYEIGCVIIDKSMMDFSFKDCTEVL